MKVDGSGKTEMKRFPITVLKADECMPDSLSLANFARAPEHATHLCDTPSAFRCPGDSKSWIAERQLQGSMPSYTLAWPRPRPCDASPPGPITTPKSARRSRPTLERSRGIPRMGRMATRSAYSRRCSGSRTSWTRSMTQSLLCTAHLSHVTVGTSPGPPRNKEDLSGTALCQMGGATG